MVVRVRPGGEVGVLVVVSDFGGMDMVVIVGCGTHGSRSPPFVFAASEGG